MCHPGRGAQMGQNTCILPWQDQIPCVSLKFQVMDYLALASHWRQAGGAEDDEERGFGPSRVLVSFDLESVLETQGKGCVPGSMESRCQLWPWAVFVLLAAPQLPGAQQACSRGACYPPAGDVLLGRVHLLRASSTCGLTKPETYCTPHGEWSMRCCRCDSRLPHAYNGHRVENVLSSAGHSRWWQSQNGIERVSLQLDLDQTFQLSSIVLHFRYLLPAAMLIERSTDFGKTWEVYQYLASDCAAAFPHIPRGSPESWQDARCQVLQGYPLHGGKVKFSVQDLASTITTSYSQTVDRLGQFTNLRINFTELPHIARQGYHSPSTFYAVTEMQVLGSCFCHGHADRCDSSGDLHTAVHGHCVCQHNTAGPNCDRCAALYNDRPWAPAQDDDPHECQRCNCNGHSASCRFDPELYRASGGVSGGVCDDCQHNTEGNNCEKCKTNYFRNQQQDLTHPEACLPCECDPDGTMPGSICDPLTGRCVCKENVQGDRCHLCKPGFTQLANANPMGCRRCTCNVLGTRQDMPCDDETGRCFCLPNVVGNDCDQCAAEHWEMGSGQGCQPCGCHPHGSHSPQCNQFTGQCPCREGFTGRTCSAMQMQVCPDRHYGVIQRGCTECDCDFQGTEDVGCDKTTGQCLCRPGVTGPRCDQCQRGHCNTYPACELCHPCFRAYDGDIQRLRLRQAGLSNSTSRMPLGSGGSRLGPRLSQAEANVQQAQSILGHSSVTEQSFAQVGSALAAIREQVQGINPDLHFLDETASLSRELEALNSSLLITNTQYQSKKTQFETSHSTDLSGAFKTIRSAYQTSTNASSLVAGASGLLAESRESRRSAAGLEGGLAEATSRLLALKGEIASSPNLTPAINKICGGFRAETCTPARCQGLLCPRDNSTTCGATRPCRGIFPLASAALATAGEAAREFRSLSARLQETAQLVKTTETSANQIQSSTRRLVEQMTVTRTQIEGDVRRIQQFIQQVRNFLSDKDTDPATIQEISESVLSLRLPTDAAAVLRKMTEIQKLATKLQCPESILAQTAEDIAKAKQLQQEAEQARNRANAVEGNVEEVVRSLRRANTVLLEAQGAIRGSGSSLRFIQERVDEIEAVLGPAEKNVKSMASQLDVLMERLSQLQRGADQNRLRATDAQQTAGAAGEQARGAQQAFEQVKQMYAELKRRMEQSPALGEQGSRVQSIDLEAQALFEETSAIMLRMETLQTEIQESNKALVSKSARLSGLEERVGRIRDAINTQVAYYESCS
ncbi:laminin subunit beta-3 isoform X2 [Falco naumanni]|uniref:laminin subunit beta-3 isoform X2 n=1 Tax=Falco naumanni TaxID=148594 RepID=UPI001ADE8594|nr:laminin subunit beta-3 isoform X2 [Falco naumanni]